MVTSAIVKCLEAYIIPDLKNYGRARLNPSQIGFVESKSTLDNIVRLNMEYKLHKKSGFLIFIDFSQAYDTINREKLYRRLNDRKILPVCKIQLIQFIHENLVIKLGNKTCKTERGVPQGLMTSPMLFNIYIETLIDELTQAQIITLAYADDIVLVIENERGIKPAIDLLEKWADLNSMKINKAKCGIIQLNKKGRKAAQQQEIFGGYPLVKSYKYLGIETEGIDSTLTYMRRIRRKVFTILSKVKPITEKMDWHKRRLILKTLVTPHVDYVGALAVVIGGSAIEKTRTLLRRATRIIFGLGPNTKNEVIEELYNTNRVKRWTERLVDILNRWKEKGMEWQLGTKMVESASLSEEVQDVTIENDLRQIPFELSSVINIYNRGVCQEHKRHLTTEHLKVHNIEVNYEIIIKMIKEVDTVKIKIIADMLKLLI